MFLFKKKRLDFGDLPTEVRDRLETLELVMMEGGDPLPTLEYVARVFPGYVPARLNVAMCRLQSGDIRGAREAYTRVRRDFPDELGALAGLAQVFAAEGDHGQARAYAERAIRAGYEWTPCYGVIAQAMEIEGDTEGAAESYLSGYRKSPHSWDYLEHYCRLKGRPFVPPTEEGEPCITLDQLRSLVAYFSDAANAPDAAGIRPGCDNTLRFAEIWAAKNGVDVIELYQFLNRHGGFCDCEVCLNVTELLVDSEAPNGPPET